MRPFIGLPSPGTQIGTRYVISREIGRGAVGVVFEARRTDTGEAVALKMLTPTSLTADGVVERFEREAELSRALTSPHTVRVLDFDVYGDSPVFQGLPYMVMGLLRGQSLEQYLATEGRLAEADAIEILGEVLESLSEAHGLGVVHRDLKPENIFLSQDDGRRVVRILDFGVAKAVRGELGSLSRELTTVGMMLGTPLYMAPEQTAGKAHVTPALDVYAVGCIAYHMLVGQPPFTGTNPFEIALKHIKEPVPSLAGHARPALAAVLERALAKDPLMRYPDARGLSIALSAGQASDDVDGAATDPHSPRAPRPSHPQLGFNDSLFDDDDDDDRTLVWQNEAIAELTYQQENSRLIPIQRRDGAFVEVASRDAEPAGEAVDLERLSKILWRSQPDASPTPPLGDELDLLDTEPMNAVKRAAPTGPLNAASPPPAPSSRGGSITEALSQDGRLMMILIGGTALAALGLFGILVAIVLLVLVQ